MSEREVDNDRWMSADDEPLGTTVDFIQRTVTVSEVSTTVDKRRVSCATCRWAAPTSGDEKFPLQCGRFTQPGALLWSEGYHENVTPDFGCVQWEAK